MSQPAAAAQPVRRQLSLDDYVAGVRAGDRAILARAITLVESRRAEHRALARDLLQAVLPFTGAAQRVGITGVPGVGKSTFIEALGGLLTGQGHKVAVLAIDPSSSRSGGSILGDKTRMETLSQNPAAFIRPSPSAGRLGGVTRMTRETMLLCEAAGYDVILVETVGAGQNETVVADMVDFFLVLMLPGAGDELQGIKKGVLELADMIAVNKCDGDNDHRAGAAVREYKSALHILNPASPTWSPPVVPCSGLTGQGLKALWEHIDRHRRLMHDSGERTARRQDQMVRWMRSMLEDGLMERFQNHPQVAHTLPDMESQVAQGTLAPSLAVDHLLATFTGQE
ncbi:methylmalonyl Co-A mutase-associated GTPase MeaB [Roseospirillum parvum]|uniref:LAO/AO transport system kinase n=1 Tax=Roseospirillum parvum TaxID=83401 RepID=A0A1G8EQR8_9PROT|nr:methylmalonyl Co-A mutase-associated GTPase MeaB [Roseospirillum parvum]SDH72228.1 LAO/AO transport system kinase [Roseospirillum parvum]